MAELSKTARASMKGEKKNLVEEEVTLEKALKVINGNLEAKLFTPTHFWVKVLEAYNEVKGLADKIGQNLLDARDQLANSEKEVLRLNTLLEASNNRLSEALNQLDEAADHIRNENPNLVSHPDGTLAPVNGASDFEPKENQGF
jgi:uncharacterized phage infection (PIP) family protein YhgE